MTGLSFVASVLMILGGGSAVAAVLFALLETQGAGANKALRTWLARRWAVVAETSWRDLPGRTVAWLLRWADRLVDVLFADADRSPGFSIVVGGLVFAVIPLAALVNAGLGGSPFLISLYGVFGGAALVLNMTAQVRGLRALNAGLAGFLGLGLAIFVPFYVVRSLTHAIQINVFSHAVLESLLVVPFWYLATYGVRLVLDGVVPASRGGLIRAAHQFLAVVPAVFVLTFFALLAGKVAVAGPDPGRSWQLLAASIATTGVSVVATLALMEAAARRPAALWVSFSAALILAAGLSGALLVLAYGGTDAAVSATDAAAMIVGQVGGTGSIHLGADFWVMHLPFIPVSAFLGFGAMTGLARLVVRVVPAGTSRPFLCSAVLCAVLAAASLGLAATL
jgi:hypothetical protein